MTKYAIIDGQANKIEVETYNVEENPLSYIEKEFRHTHFWFGGEFKNLDDEFNGLEDAITYIFKTLDISSKLVSTWLVGVGCDESKIAEEITITCATDDYNLAALVFLRHYPNNLIDNLLSMNVTAHCRNADLPNLIIEPIYVYDHSGQTLMKTCYDRWDSSFIGIQFAFKRKDDDTDVRAAMNIEFDNLNRYVEGWALEVQHYEWIDGGWDCIESIETLATNDEEALKQSGFDNNSWVTEKPWSELTEDDKVILKDGSILGETGWEDIVIHLYDTPYTISITAPGQANHFRYNEIDILTGQLIDVGVIFTDKDIKNTVWVKEEVIQMILDDFKKPNAEYEEIRIK